MMKLMITSIPIWNFSMVLQYICSGIVDGVAMSKIDLYLMKCCFPQVIDDEFKERHLLPSSMELAEVTDEDANLAKRMRYGEGRIFYPAFEISFF